MNVMHRVARFTLELNKIQTEALVRLYGRLGLYQKLYTACGLPDEVAARIEQKIIEALFSGIDEQHVLASRWVNGEIDLADFLDRYRDWFREYMYRCGRIVVEAVQPAA